MTRYQVCVEVVGKLQHVPSSGAISALGLAQLAIDESAKLRDGELASNGWTWKHVETVVAAIQARFSIPPLRFTGFDGVEMRT